MTEALSSSTFASDIDDNQIGTTNNKLLINDLQLQVQRSKDQNHQLQNSIKLLKRQLNEALSASKDKESLQTQNSSLEAKLSKANELNSNLKNQIDALNQQILIMADEHKNYVSKHTKEIRQYADTIGAMHKQIEKLELQRDAVAIELKEKSEIFEVIQSKILDIKKQKKRAIEHSKLLAEKLYRSEATIKSIKTDNADLTAQNHKLTQDIDTLNLQLGTCNAINEGNEKAIKALNEDVQSKVSSLASLEETLSAQRTEIEYLCAQRDMMVNLVQKTHKAFCSAELLCSGLKSENDTLKNKLHNRNGHSNSRIHRDDCVSINEIILPFEGKIGENCYKILKFEHYQPQQRLNMVFSELSKEFNNISNTTDNIKKEYDEYKVNFESVEKKAGLYCELLSSLLKELKNIAINEAHISKNFDCKSDSKFVAFIANKCSEIDPIIKDIDPTEAKFIPSYFLFSDDLAQRQQTIQRLLQPNDETFAIFTTQFLINIALQRQLNKAMYAISSIDDSVEALKTLGCNKASDMVTLLDKINEKIEKGKHQRKQLRGQVRLLQSELEAKNKLDSEKYAEFDQIKLDNESLRSEIEVLNCKVQTLQSEINIKTDELKTLQTNNDNFTTLVTRNKQLENEKLYLEEKVEKLSLAIDNMRSSMEETELQSKREVKRAEENCSKAVEEAHNLVAIQEAKCERRIARMRRVVKRVKDQAQEQIDELSNRYEESKTNFNNMYSQINEKSKQSQEMTQKLIQALDESEKKNQASMEENTRLIAKQKQLEAQVRSQQDKLLKEKQQMQNQLTAESLFIETKLQEKCLNIKSECMQEKQKLLNFVATTIGDIYSIDKKGFDEACFEQLMVQVKKDLERLKVFRNSAFIYHPAENASAMLINNLVQ